MHAWTLKLALTVVIAAASLTGLLPDARASVERGFSFGPEAVSPRESDKSAAPSADEIYRRTQAVMAYYGVAAEPESQPVVDRMAGIQTEAGLRAMLEFLDAKSQFNRYFTLDSASFVSAQDRDSKKLVDFAAPLHASASADDADRSFDSTRLASLARSNPADQPLKGLRIAIDPGHMGGDLWDERTGKFVIEHASGHKLSEGVMNLQTSMLLESRFKSLGADVMLTHRGLGPVSEIPYEKIDVAAFAREELRAVSLQDWFQNLLTSGPVGQALYAAFDSSSNRKKLFSESSRSTYFISREDLEARARVVEAYDPDLTLIIHYDTSDPPGDPNGTSPSTHNGTKAYVAGSFDSMEYAQRDDRLYFAKHALQGSFWWQSARLGQSVVEQIRTQMGIPLDTTGAGVSKQVVPGVWSRNLALNRRIPGRVVSFIECMYYNTTEFSALYRQTNPMTIDGRSLPYSNRLAQMAKSIGDGVLGYVAGLKQSSLRIP